MVYGSGEMRFFYHGNVDRFDDKLSICVAEEGQWIIIEDKKKCVLFIYENNDILVMKFRFAVPSLIFLVGFNDETRIMFKQG